MISVRFLILHLEFILFSTSQCHHNPREHGILTMNQQLQRHVDFRIVSHDCSVQDDEGTWPYMASPLVNQLQTSRKSRHQ